MNEKFYHKSYRNNMFEISLDYKRNTYKPLFIKRQLGLDMRIIEY